MHQKHRVVRAGLSPADFLRLEDTSPKMITDASSTAARAGWPGCASERWFRDRELLPCARLDPYERMVALSARNILARELSRRRLILSQFEGVARLCGVTTCWRHAGVSLGRKKTLRPAKATMGESLTFGRRTQTAGRRSAKLPLFDR